jgi:hypothetical protein
MLYKLTIVIHSQTNSTASFNRLGLLCKHAAVVLLHAAMTSKSFQNVYGSAFVGKAR